MNQSIVDVDIRIESPKGIRFDKQYMRAGMKILGREVQKEARNLVNHRGGSKADEFPAKVTGTLSRSIGYKIGSGGFYVVVQPRRTTGFGEKEFYPAFLHHGVRRNRKKNHKKQSADTPYRIEPRKNYMAETLERKRERVRQVIGEAIQRGLQAG